MYCIRHWVYTGKQNGHSSCLPGAYSLVGKTDINSLLTWISARKEKYRNVKHRALTYLSQCCPKELCDDGHVLYSVHAKTVATCAFEMCLVAPRSGRGPIPGFKEFMF